MVAPTARTPIDLGYMASAMDLHGFGCTIRDYPAEGKNWVDFRNDLHLFRPDYLIASTTTPTLLHDLEAFAMAKEAIPEITTIAKGAHFLAESEDILKRTPSLDLVIRGECEEPVAEIAAGNPLPAIRGLTFRLDGQILKTPPRPFLQSLDSLPIPARHLMRNYLYKRPDTGLMQTTVLASRGCPHRCVFCLAGIVHGQPLRTRSPNRIAGEVTRCMTDFHMKNFYFQADSFTLDRIWTLEFCGVLRSLDSMPEWVCNSRVDCIDLELATRMKEAGCWGITFGLESGSTLVLERMDKKISLESSRGAVEICRKVGLKVSLMFLIGLPWDTEASIKETIRFAKTLPGHVYEFNLAYPFPGTELHRIAVRRGLIAGGGPFGYDFTSPSLSTFQLTTKKLASLRRRAFLAVYARPVYLLRMLKEVRSPSEFGRFIRFGITKLLTFFRKDARAGSVSA